jgi:protein-S-isoprenylcysteine O-methyltransferase Ste14
VFTKKQFGILWPEKFKNSEVLMNGDLLLRSVLAALAAALYIHHLVYGKRFPDSKMIVGLGEMALIVAASLWTASLIGYVFGLSRFGVHTFVPGWVRWSGIACMTLCIPLSKWVYRTLGVHFSTKLQLLTDHRLVESGPYRFVRHPMYSTFILCAIGAGLASADLSVLVTGAATATAMVFRIKKEERMLVQRFGEEYREYRRRTWALVPRFGTLL